MTSPPRLVERAWRREGFSGRTLAAFLLPAAAGFSAVARLRVWVYRLHLRRRHRLPAAVVSVGNLSIGGTGKTPTALWLAEAIVRRGYRVAIVSRGYGGIANEPTLADGSRSAPPRGLAVSREARVVGDEALLLARRFDGPVIVARRRAEAGSVACREFGAQVLILDDGFQHLPLHRDFDLVCLRPSAAGADRVLPAGRLREPPSALRRADAVLVTGGAPGERPPTDRKLGSGAVPVYQGSLRATGLVTPGPGGWREMSLGVLATRSALGVSGVADPGSFHRTLREWDARVEDFLEFPDHHVYTAEDWKTIASRSRGVDLVVTTEKDLVKLERFPFAKDKLVGVRVSMEIVDGERLLESVIEAAHRRHGAARS